MKFCKDCKYLNNQTTWVPFWPLGGYYQLNDACTKNSEFNPVSGTPITWIDAYKYRAFPSPIENKCGPEGKHWEKKSEKNYGNLP